MISYSHVFKYSLAQMKKSSKGWNFGQISSDQSLLKFKTQQELIFQINYNSISNCLMPGRNQIALQFQQHPQSQSDFLYQMRIFIPQTDTCEQVCKQIQQQSKLKSQGQIIVNLLDLPFSVPRGKYSIDMYKSFMRLHGATHNYRLLYKSLLRAFLLPHPDQVHVSLVINVDPPLRQGNTFYPFIIIKFQKEDQDSLTLNLTPEEISEFYGNTLEENLQGKTFDLVSRLLKALAGTTIVIPGQFRSFNNNHSIKCSTKAQEGLLFPLKRSFIFIGKPVVHIRFQDIRFIELERVTSRPSNRSFDIHIFTKQGNYQFTGIDNHQLSVFHSFLEHKKISIRTEEEEIKQAPLIEEEEEDDDDSFQASDDNQPQEFN